MSKPGPPSRSAPLRPAPPARSAPGRPSDAAPVPTPVVSPAFVLVEGFATMRTMSIAPSFTPTPTPTDGTLAPSGPRASVSSPRSSKIVAPSRPAPRLASMSTTSPATGITNKISPLVVQDVPTGDHVDLASGTSTPPVEPSLTRATSADVTASSGPSLASATSTSAASSSTSGASDTSTLPADQHGKNDHGKTETVITEAASGGLKSPDKTKKKVSFQQEEAETIPHEDENSKHDTDKSKEIDKAVQKEGGTESGEALTEKADQAAPPDWDQEIPPPPPGWDPENDDSDDESSSGSSDSDEYTHDGRRKGTVSKADADKKKVKSVATSQPKSSPASEGESQKVELAPSPSSLLLDMDSEPTEPEAAATPTPTTEGTHIIKVESDVPENSVLRKRARSRRRKGDKLSKKDDADPDDDKPLVLPWTDDPPPPDKILVRLKLPPSERRLHQTRECVFICKEDMTVGEFKREMVVDKLWSLRSGLTSTAVRPSIGYFASKPPNIEDIIIATSFHGRPLSDDTSLLALCFGGRESVFGAPAMTPVASEATPLGHQTVTLCLKRKVKDETSLRKQLIRVVAPELKTFFTVRANVTTTILQLKEMIRIKLRQKGFRRRFLDDISEDGPPVSTASMRLDDHLPSKIKFKLSEFEDDPELKGITWADPRISVSLQGTKNDLPRKSVVVRTDAIESPKDKHLEPLKECPVCAAKLGPSAPRPIEPCQHQLHLALPETTVRSEDKTVGVGEIKLSLEYPRKGGKPPLEDALCALDCFKIPLTGMHAITTPQAQPTLYLTIPEA